MSGGKGKNKGGRSSVMTDEVLRKLEYAFAMGATDKEACFHAGIGASTLYDYQKENPEFSERKWGLKGSVVLKAKTNIASAIDKGDTDLSKWYLERKAKEEFSPRAEVTGADGEALLPPSLNINFVKPKSDD